MKKKKQILKLQTFNWNKLTRGEQNRSLKFMRRMLEELDKYRKYGYDDKFWAEYP